MPLSNKQPSAFFSVGGLQYFRGIWKAPGNRSRFRKDPGSLRPIRVQTYYSLPRNQVLKRHNHGVAPRGRGKKGRPLSIIPHFLGKTNDFWFVSEKGEERYDCGPVSG